MEHIGICKMWIDLICFSAPAFSLVMVPRRLSLPLASWGDHPSQSYRECSGGWKMLVSSSRFFFLNGLDFYVQICGLYFSWDWQKMKEICAFIWI